MNCLLAVEVELELELGPWPRTRLVDQCNAQTQINTCLLETPPYPKAHPGAQSPPRPSFKPPIPKTSHASSPPCQADSSSKLHRSSILG